MNSAIGRRNLILLAIGAAVGRHAHAGVSWRLATGYPADAFHTTNLVQLAAEVERDTQGELRIEVHPNNSLVKLAEVTGAVSAGKVEAGETIMTTMVGDMPIAGADSVPFIVGTYKDAERMWRLQRPLVEKHLRERGVQVLYAVPWPPQGLFSTRPIIRTGDLKGARMRTYNATTERIAALLGAQAVDVPLTQIRQALADGKIDSMITSAFSGVQNQVWSSVKHYYEINAWFPKNIVMVNSAAMKALSPAAREALLKAAAAAEARGWAQSAAVAADSVEELRKNGVKVERISHEFSVDIKRLGDKFSLEWLRAVGPEANRIFVPYFQRE